MKVLFALLACTLVAIVVAKPNKGEVSRSAEAICTNKKGKGEKLKGFNAKTVSIAFPCKYPALVNHTCGEHVVTLTPGNKWFGSHYQLDTAWLALRNSDGEYIFEGRTSNKKLGKFFNNQSDNFLTPRGDKGNAYRLSDVFQTPKRLDGESCVTALNNDFTLCFKHWDSCKAADARRSSFQFTCHVGLGDIPVDHGFPRQYCDGVNKTNSYKAVTAKEAEFEKKMKNVVGYYYLFTNKDVVQMDGRCKAAVETFTNCGSKENQVEVMSHCYNILRGGSGTKCITKYSCDPMDTFNACLRWGCNGEGQFSTDGDGYDDCALTGEGIDLCTGLNRTRDLVTKVEDSKCYKINKSFSNKCSKN